MLKFFCFGIMLSCVRSYSGPKGATDLGLGSFWPSPWRDLCPRVSWQSDRPFRSNKVPKDREIRSKWSEKRAVLGALPIAIRMTYRPTDCTVRKVFSRGMRNRNSKKIGDCFGAQKLIERSQIRYMQFCRKSRILGYLWSLVARKRMKLQTCGLDC